MTDGNEERIGLAKQRVSDMLALADVLGAEVGSEEIRKAALVELSPIAERFVTWVVNCAQDNIVAATRVLAGQGDDEVMAFIMNKIDAMRLTPSRRPRPCRPTAAERAQAATKFLNGPAWEVVDTVNDHNPSPDGGCM